LDGRGFLSLKEPCNIKGFQFELELEVGMEAPSNGKKFEEFSKWRRLVQRKILRSFQNRPMERCW
jgi:hypothetical protein